jgi:hypothetical protein
MTKYKIRPDLATENDYFESSRQACIGLFNEKGFDPSILDDDDRLHDFLIEIDRNEIKHDFDFHDKCLLYSYNRMLQTIAFNIDDIDFKVVRSPLMDDEDYQDKLITLKLDRLKKL